MVDARSIDRFGRRAKGRCPTCDGWFDCDAWFDIGAPLPTCPRCGCPPGTLVYQCGGGWRTVPETEGG